MPGLKNRTRPTLRSAGPAYAEWAGPGFGPAGEPRAKLYVERHPVRPPITDQQAADGNGRRVVAGAWYRGQHGDVLGVRPPPPATPSCSRRRSDRQRHVARSTARITLDG